MPRVSLNAPRFNSVPALVSLASLRSEMCTLHAFDHNHWSDPRLNKGAKHSPEITQRVQIPSMNIYESTCRLRRLDSTCVKAHQLSDYFPSLSLNVSRSGPLHTGPVLSVTPFISLTSLFFFYCCFWSRALIPHRGNYYTAN